jgi:hypothetical protein
MPKSSAVGRHSIQRLRATADLLDVRAHAAATPSLTVWGRPSTDGVLFWPKWNQTVFWGLKRARAGSDRH